jgi:integrase
MAGITLWLQLGEDMKKLAKPIKPARLIQAKQGWYVNWYCDNQRYRIKNGLNTIKDVNTRLFFGNRIVDFINSILLEKKVIRDVDLPNYLFDFSRPIPSICHDKFLIYFENVFIERLKIQDLSFYTIRKHITLLHSLKDFAAFKGVVDFHFNQIDRNWAISYKVWRYSEPRAHHINYVSKDFEYIKRVLREAEAYDGISINQQYKTDAFSIKRIVSDEISLTFAELKQIYELDLSDLAPGFDTVRYDFVLASLTGLRWGNWQIKKENIMTVDGRKMIKLVTEKNYQSCLIPLHPLALEILERFDFQMPTISQQNTNEYIKIIAEKAGFTEIVLLKDSKGGKVITTANAKCDEISTHTARRSFVTIALMEWKLPPQYIMPLTGHQTQKQLFEYARVDKNWVAVEIAKIFDSF